MTLERLHPAPKRGLGRCPYCHEGIDPREVDLWSCPGCGAHHHRECLEEFGHCSVYGCGNTTPAARALSPSEFEALKARRRARRFAALHQTAPRSPRAPRPDPPETAWDRWERWFFRNLPRFVVAGLIVGPALVALVSWLLGL